MTQIPLPQGSYKHPSRPTNYQECINYFPSPVGTNGRGAITLLPTRGSQLITNLGTDEIRLVKYINNILYVVCGNTFYSVIVDVNTLICTCTTIGTLNTSSGPVIATNNPTQIILLDGVDGYIYNYIFAGTVALGSIGGASGDTYTLVINGTNIYTSFNVAAQILAGDVLASTINNNTATTGVVASFNSGLLTLTAMPGITSITVTESGTNFLAGTDGITVSPGVFDTSLGFEQFQVIPDPNFIAGSHVVYIDGYFIVNRADSQVFAFSQPNEGRVWNALDVASAESKPDNIIAVGETKSEAWFFGTNSIEVWYDNGNAEGSPFSKQQGADIDIGCIAPYSVTNVNDLLVWIDSRGFIVQSDVSPLLRNTSTGYTLTKISTDALDTEISAYIRIDDAIGTTYVDRGNIMLEMTFPSAKKTWVFSFTTSLWHERNFTNTSTGNQEHSLNQYCDTYNGLLICGGVRDGSLYVMSEDYFLDNTTPITRIFTTQHFSDDFSELGFDGLELKLETGFAPSDGSASKAQVMMQFSHNSGFLWSKELMRPIGAKGEYAKRIIWNMLGSSNQWIFLFKITAPFKHAVVDLTANISKEMQ